MGQSKRGFYDESRMHGRVFETLDTIRGALSQLAINKEVTVTVNRFYLTNRDVIVNFSVDKQMYLVTVIDGGYEVVKTNKKSKLPNPKRQASIQQIASGDFVTLFETA